MTTQILKLKDLEPEKAPSIDWQFRQFEGLQEFDEGDNPAILAAHRYGAKAPWFERDEIPWCSSILCLAAEMSDRINPGSARARSWLMVGATITIENWLEALTFNDFEVARNTVVIFNRGGPMDPTVIRAKGHVAQLLEYNPEGALKVRGGNQSDEVNHRWYPESEVLGLRYCPVVY